MSGTYRIGLPPVHTWPGEPACLTVDDKDMFFSLEPHDQAEALQVCNGCPVQPDCLEYALTIPDSDDDGVIGGTTYVTRRGMRARARRARRAA